MKFHPTVNSARWALFSVALIICSAAFAQAEKIELMCRTEEFGTESHYSIDLSEKTLEIVGTRIKSAIEFDEYSIFIRYKLDEKYIYTLELDRFTLKMRFLDLLNIGGKTHVHSQCKKIQPQI